MRIGPVEFVREHRASGLANPAGWMFDAFAGTSTYAGEPVNVTDAVGLGDVYAAVTVISEAVGGLPFKVYRTLDDGGYGERVEARGHRMWRILNEAPNAITDRHRFWATVVNHLLLWGNAFIVKERDDTGTVESLWVEDPAGLVVESDGRTKSFYRDGVGGRRRWTAETMLHVSGPSLNGLTGVSPIAMCRQTFGTAIARSKFEGSFYRRGARMPAVIQHPGRLGAEGIDGLRRQFERWHSGVDQMHRVPVLEEGAQLNSLSMPLADLQFVESQQLSRQQFANIFHLPASYLNASTGDSLTYATIESNSIQFGQLSVSPWTGTIAGAVNADPALFPQTAVYAEHVLEALYKADLKSRAEWWEKLHGMGVVDEAYIASRENLPAPPVKEEPVAVPTPPADGQAPGGNGNGAVPPEMIQMQDALKSASG